MRKHLELKHDVATGSPPRKRRRHSIPNRVPVTVAPPTERVPAQTLAVERYTLSSKQDGFFSNLGTIDLGPEPDVTISEPVSYTPNYGPTTSAVSDFSSLGLISNLPNSVSLPSSVSEVLASLPDSPSPAVVQYPISRLSRPFHSD